MCHNPYFSGLSFATVDEWEEIQFFKEVTILILVDFLLQQSLTFKARKKDKSQSLF